MLDKKRLKQTNMSNAKIGEVFAEVAGGDPLNPSTVAFCVNGQCNACRSGVPRHETE